VTTTGTAHRRRQTLEPERQPAVKFPFILSSINWR
jgi:hypothetical protein